MDFEHTLSDECFRLNYYHKKNLRLSCTSIEHYRAAHPYIYIYIDGELPLFLNEFLPQKLEIFDTFIIPWFMPFFQSFICKRGGWST